LAKDRDGRRRDRAGRSGVGRRRAAHQDLEAIKLPRDQVFICNIVKCGPQRTGCRSTTNPACLPFLYRQLELVKRGHFGDGRDGAQSLLNTKQSLGSLRNQVHRFRGIPVS